MSNLLLLTSLDSTEVFALGMTVSLHTKGFSASLYVIPSSVAGAHPRDRLTAPSFARPPLRLSVRALSDWKGCASGGLVGDRAFVCLAAYSWFLAWESEMTRMIMVVTILVFVCMLIPKWHIHMHMRSQ